MQTQTDINSLKEIYSLCCRKASLNCKKIGHELREFPGSGNGEYFAGNREGLIPLRHIFSWTQSFFTGMAALAYMENNDEGLRRWLLSFYREYHDKVTIYKEDTMHDIGFLYTLYSRLLYKIERTETLRNLSLQAAEVLAGRFVESGGYIRAWGRMDETIPEYVDDALAANNFFSNSKGLMIIDCLMNISLLFWAWKETGQEKYGRIAKSHADVSLKYLVREDGSIRHAYRFDEEGNSVGEFNDCGYAIGSHWARGSAWAIYGFAVAYSYTEDKKYLEASAKILDKFIEECGDDPVPVWDFRVPMNISLQKPDTSAAVIVGCGIEELLRFGKNRKYEEYQERMLQTICHSYINRDLECPGILSHQNGRDVYCCFGDYFFMELLCKKLKGYFQIW